MKQNDLYKEKLINICDFIEMNIENDLSLEKLSEISGVSKFHFHRLFFAYMGINIYFFIRLVRFKKASYELVFKKNKKIIDIAFDARFESPEAFARAFKKVFGVTPSQFRRKPSWDDWHEKYDFITLTGEKDMKVNIVGFASTKIAVLEHNGPHTLLNDSIARFIDWRKSSMASPISKSRTFGLVYGDPKTTPPKKFRFDICGEITQKVEQNKYGIIEKEIPEGQCAVIRHQGSHDNMEEAIYCLYREWLPSSGKEIRNFPLYFQYHNFFPEVVESELITDIFLPIK